MRLVPSGNRSAGKLGQRGASLALLRTLLKVYGQPSSRSHGCGKEALHEHAIIAITNDDERASQASTEEQRARESRDPMRRRESGATCCICEAFSAFVAPQRCAPTPGQPHAFPRLGAEGPAGSEVVPRTSGARVPQLRRLLSHREDSQAKSHQRLVTLPRSIDITTTRQGSLTLHCPRTIDATRLGDGRRGAQDTIAVSDRVVGNEGSPSHPHPAVGADEPREPEH